MQLVRLQYISKVARCYWIYKLITVRLISKSLLKLVKLIATCEYKTFNVQVGMNGSVVFIEIRAMYT